MRVGNITFDCDDVPTVANFWSEALGRPLDPASGPVWASSGVSDPERTEPAWFFEKVPETKQAKNRMHLDFVDPDPEVVPRLVALGAKVIGERAVGLHGWTVLQDPEGNEFCVAKRSYTG